MKLNKVLSLSLGFVCVQALSCTENIVKFTPEIGLPNCEIGMKKSDIPSELTDSLGKKLIFDSDEKLFAIVNIKDRKYFIESHNLQVGDLLKDSESQTRPLLHDSMSFEQKFSSNDGEKSILYPDGMIFDIDENGRIVSFSLIAKPQ